MKKHKKLEKSEWYLCPTCKQDMRTPPHKGMNGKDCPQCGQGISWRKARKDKP